MTMSNTMTGAPAQENAHFLYPLTWLEWRPLALANLILICAASHWIFSFICSSRRRGNRRTIKAKPEHNYLQEVEVKEEEKQEEE